jgi:hypothetical protein
MTAWAIKTELKRVAEQNKRSQRWRVAVYYTDGSMRRLKGAFLSVEEALHAAHTPKPAKPKQIPLDIVCEILAAVAAVEGWDDAHPSVMMSPDGGWVTAFGLPMPSTDLISQLARVRAQRERR